MRLLGNIAVSTAAHSVQPGNMHCSITRFRLVRKLVGLATVFCQSGKGHVGHVIVTHGVLLPVQRWED